MSVSNTSLTFSRKLDSTLLQSFGGEDVLNTFCGIPGDTRCGTLILSPYMPDEFFSSEEAQLQRLGSGFYGDSWLIRWAHRSLHWIRCGGSAGSVMELCLALNQLNCQKILFLDECVSLRPEHSNGSLIVPNKAISGTGATRYLCDDMSGDPTFLKERRTPPKGILWLSKAAIHTETAIHTATVFSTDSILGAMAHPAELEETGAEALDRAASAFARCMILMERPGAALLAVTRQRDAAGRLVSASLEERSAAKKNILTMLNALT